MVEWETGPTSSPWSEANRALVTAGLNKFGVQQPFDFDKKWGRSVADCC